MSVTDSDAMRAIVADDEPHALRSLELALESVSGVEVVGACSGGRQAIEAIRREAPDIVFLDVSMPGADGFEVACAVDAGPAVVFVTAHAGQAFRAFDIDAVDYVLKPFDDERIERAVERARTRIRARGQARTAAFSDPTPERASRFLVREADRSYFVRVVDVDWIEADAKSVLLHANGETHRVRKSLTGVLARLDPALFQRVHRSHAVNVDRVTELFAWFGGDYVAVLEDGTELRVSRTYSRNLLVRVV